MDYHHEFFCPTPSKARVAFSYLHTLSQPLVAAEVGKETMPPAAPFQVGLTAFQLHPSPQEQLLHQLYWGEDSTNTSSKLFSLNISFLSLFLVLFVTYRLPIKEYGIHMKEACTLIFASQFSFEDKDGFSYFTKRKLLRLGKYLGRPEKSFMPYCFYI